MGERDLAAAVIADDLSGGADCGVAFAHAGLDVAIQLDRAAVPPPWARVAVVPTDSRDEDPEQARAAVAEAVTALARCHPALWYKKIDSTLRGHLALELAATIRGVRPELSVVAPAFPAHGRTLAGGHGFLNGVPLDRTEVWRAQGLAGAASLPAMLHVGGLRVTELRLGDIRAGRVADLLTAAAGAADVVVCDAETEDDLAAIAAGGLASGLNVLWAGSAGLARHLAPLSAPSLGAPDPGAPRVNAAGLDAAGLDAAGLDAAGLDAAGLDAAEPDGPEPDGPGLVAEGGSRAGSAGERRPVAVVVGSAAGAASAQFRHLESRPGTRVVRVRPAPLLHASEGAAERAAAEREFGAALAQGQDVALGLVPPDSRDEFVLDSETSRALSRGLGQIVGRHNDMIGGLVLTGGDTALAVLRACGITTLRPLGEVVTGVPVSSGPDGRLAVTKAGAFGDDTVLALAADVARGGEPRFIDARSMERSSSRVRF
jgi:4-hydroxythreonine-4-phosphate dehydrogenase